MTAERVSEDVTVCYIEFPMTQNNVTIDVTVCYIVFPRTQNNVTTEEVGAKPKESVLSPLTLLLTKL